MLKSKIMITVTLLSLTATAFAQGPRAFPRTQSSTGSTPGQTAQANAIAAIQTALTLTSAQVMSLQSLMATRKTAMQTVQQDRQTKEKALRTLMAEQSPDPTALGNAMLAVRGIPAEEKQVETQFQTSFVGILTPAQQQIYGALQNAAQNMGPFRALGLIGGGPGGGRGMGRGGPRGMMRGRFGGPGGGR